MSHVSLLFFYYKIYFCFVYLIKKILATLDPINLHLLAFFFNLKFHNIILRLDMNDFLFKNRSFKFLCYLPLTRASKFPYITSHPTLQ